MSAGEVHVGVQGPGTQEGGGEICFDFYYFYYYLLSKTIQPYNDSQ